MTTVSPLSLQPAVSFTLNQYNVLVVAVGPVLLVDAEKVLRGVPPLLDGWGPVAQCERPQQTFYIVAERAVAD